MSPVIFHSYAELEWGFWFLAVLVVWIHWRERSQWCWSASASVAQICNLLYRRIAFCRLQHGAAHGGDTRAQAVRLPIEAHHGIISPAELVMLPAAGGVPALSAGERGWDEGNFFSSVFRFLGTRPSDLSAQRRWPVWPAALVGAVVLGGVFLWQSFDADRDTIRLTRNFYGVLRVTERGAGTPLHAYKLNHGTTTHGIQFANPQRSGLATTYYHENSGVGVALNYFPRQTNRCVGVVGLGVGTLAAYGRPGDMFRFYEINPEVCRLAQNGFSFIKNSSARIEIVPGDARLSLENEPARQYDLLVLDAFTSDAIPVHLLTQEAFQTYFQHLKPDGAILVHISNRHLNFLPVLVGVAKRFQSMLMCLDWDGPNRPWWFSTARWVILSRNQAFMLSEPVLSRASRMPESLAKNPNIWTDDYASLFSIITH